MIRRWPIRVRLTAAFAVMMAVTLAAVGYATVTHTRSFLDRSITESLEYRLDELRPQAVAAHPELPGPNHDTAVQILSGSGSVVAATAELSGPPVLSAAEAAAAGRGTLLVDHPTAGSLAGPVRLAATAAPGDRLLVAAQSLADRDVAVTHLTRELAIGFPLVLVVAVLGAYLLAMAALRPVERMRVRAAGITDTDSGAQLPVPRTNDEISRLGTTFNDLLRRLQDAVERERQFVADAGHELRTPLGLLTTELELALRRPRSNDELVAALRSALDEVERLSRLARAMLAATASSHHDGATQRPVVLLIPLIDAVIARHGSNGQDTTVDGPPAVKVCADPDDLDRILTNLLDNALEHGAPPVHVQVDCPDTATVVVRVRDHGLGIDPVFLPHAFDRFTRADTARTRGGSGLGLAIVAALAQRNQATVTATNHPQGGLTVILTLPRSSAPS